MPHPPLAAPALPTGTSSNSGTPGSTSAPRDRLLAVQSYRAKVGGHYPICGWVEGAAAEAR